MSELHKRRIRSSTAKKDVMKDWAKRDASNIRLITSWPPGTFMVYDNTMMESVQAGRERKHTGLGIVVANDGVSRIRVLWDSGCSRQFLEYHVEALNPNVIFHMA